jgi:Flp pilus assembly pilin Flp
VEALEVALIGGLIVIVILVAVPTLATGVGDALDGLTAAFANVRTGIN